MHHNSYNATTHTRDPHAGGSQKTADCTGNQHKLKACSGAGARQNTAKCMGRQTYTDAQVPLPHKTLLARKESRHAYELVRVHNKSADPSGNKQATRKQGSTPMWTTKDHQLHRPINAGYKHALAQRHERTRQNAREPRPLMNAPAHV